MSVIEDIQQELIDLYEGFTLPNGLGSPTGYKLEPSTPLESSDLPAVVVERGIKTGSIDLSEDMEQITREYIVDLFCYQVASNDDPFESVRHLAVDCIEVIERGLSPSILDTNGVLSHRLDADTGDTELFSRHEDYHYIGVRFRHTVTYIQIRS